MRCQTVRDEEGQTPRPSGETTGVLNSGFLVPVWMIATQLFELVHTFIIQFGVYHCCGCLGHNLSKSALVECALDHVVMSLEGPHGGHRLRKVVSTLPLLTHLLMVSAIRKE